MDKNEILLGFGIVLLVILFLSLLMTYLSLLKMSKKLDETLDEVAELRYRIIKTEDYCTEQIMSLRSLMKGLRKDICENDLE